MRTSTAEQVQAENIRGHIDHVGADGASGWLCHLVHCDSRLSVEAVVDGVAVAKAKAEAFRPDILELGISDGYSGFRLTFPDDCFDGAEHDVVLRVAETGGLLTEKPVKVRFPENVVVPAVVGFLEHVDPGLFVSGWALSAAGGTARVQVAVNGAVVAAKEACLVRPDLIIEGIPSGRAAFKISIPGDAIARLENEVAVMVDGQPLHGSPRRLDLGHLLDVRVEEARHGMVYVRVGGWPGKALTGCLFLDGILVADVELRRPRKQTGQARQGHEGAWAIPEELQDGQPHVYSFEIADGETIVRSDAVLLSYPQYHFWVEHADTESISGWAYRGDSAAQLTLEVYGDGKLVGEGDTSVPRPGVAQNLKLNDQRCGFDIKFDASLAGSACHLLLRDTETGIAIAEVSVVHRYEALAEITTGLARQLAGTKQALLHAVLAPLMISSTDETGFAVRALPKARATAPVDAVDVVIPVYGGCMETAECLESVLSVRNETASRIIVVNDCSPDPLINGLLNALGRRGREDLIILHRTQNGGFSEAVNIGMAVAGDRHVVILNADTVVQDGWIDRLMAAANSDPMIGTVTPLTNNGEIVTVPYPCKSLVVDNSALAGLIDKVAAECNAGKTVDIPVAIGFCMLIRRECVNEIGPFDAATWGRGYGEEVDFCLKARARGWRHVVATDTFVVHRGSVSFGDEKLERIIESARKITELYPFYDQLIRRFITMDPIGPVRRSINLDLISGALGGDRVLHVTHSFGGGTEKYVRDVSALQVEEGQVPLVLRFDEKGRAELQVDLAETELAGFFSDCHTEAYKAAELEVLKADIGRLKIKRLHLHSPFGMPIEFLDWLTSSLPFRATIHDYAWICPRVTLTQGGGRYCGEPPAEQCDSCVAIYSAHPGLRDALRASGKSVATYRQNMGAFLGRAETVYAGVNDVVKRLQVHGVEAAYHVTPHPEPEVEDRLPALGTAPAPVDGNLRVALFGGITDIKGFHQLIACAKYAQEMELPITFIVLGYTMNDELASSLPNIIISGPYEEVDLDELVRKYKPNLSFFPNQWPETYSYTLSHSFRLGLWPVVTGIGAPAERISDMKWGSIVELDEPPYKLVHMLLEIGLQRNKSVAIQDF